MGAAPHRRRAEYGDFQTPATLARGVVARLARDGIAPRSLVEPTCGEGALLHAALAGLPGVEHALAVDREPRYVERARAAAAGAGATVALHTADFFAFDWAEALAPLPDPLLVLGNPPWVTNSALSRLGSANLPPKANDEGRSGLEAATGRSNFDISEWMLRRMLGWLAGRRATLAMLCKTQVARRVLAAAWQADAPLAAADLFRIDAAAHFGASVDAGLLVVSSHAGAPARECRTHAGLDPIDAIDAIDPIDHEATATFGLRGGELVADVAAHARTQRLAGRSPERYRWRSGIKHDCAAVMELRERDGALVNGLGEPVDVEPEMLFPLCKSSMLGSERPPGAPRWLIVPQRATGEDTTTLRTRAPRTWRYLCAHGERLDARRSRVYRGRPRFAVFGIGPYSFAPWKVAISGLYKRLRFRLVGPHDGRPTVLDDTGYALACGSEEEAKWLLGLLESPPAREFFSARVFWDAKRPITAALLGRLDLARLAEALGEGARMRRYASLELSAPAPAGSIGHPATAK